MKNIIDVNNICSELKHNISIFFIDYYLSINELADNIKKNRIYISFNNYLKDTYYYYMYIVKGTIKACIIYDPIDNKIILKQIISDNNVNQYFILNNFIKKYGIVYVKYLNKKYDYLFSLFKNKLIVIL